MVYMSPAKKVNGEKKADIFLFSLSTCGWCMKTKKLLDSLNVEYDYVDVDLLETKKQKEIQEEFRGKSIGFSFPKIFINDKVISGFDEKKILEEIK